MNNNYNNRYNQQNQQHFQQNQYLSYPNQPGGVSGREMFVGLNILSKIGVLFLIVGVIAFSAVSGEYISGWIRMGMVFAVGILMLAVGEVFYRKHSKAFAFTLIYGGVAELFVGLLIGYHGFRLLNGFAVIGAGIAVSAAGILLSQRYKSQAMLIITVIMSTLLIYLSNADTGLVYCLAAVVFILVHCANAIIARRNNLVGAYIAGFCVMLFQTPVVNTSVGMWFYRMTPYTGRAQIFAAVFIFCGAFIYTAGPILNAISGEGRMRAVDLTGAAVTQGFMMYRLSTYIGVAAGAKVSGVVILVLAVIYALTAAVFALRFGARRQSDRLMTNLALVAVVVGIWMVIDARHISYIAMHLLGTAVFAIGSLAERKLFRIWGIVLLSVSEVMFLSVYFTYESLGKKLFIALVNMALFVGLMLLLMARKKSDTNPFRAYMSVVLSNVGILGSNLICVNLSTALEKFGIWEDKWGRAAFLALVCAVLWMLIGFVAGKLKYMRTVGLAMLITFDVIGLMCLLFANWECFITEIRGDGAGLIMFAVTIAVNVVSVLSVLDITLQIYKRAPKFAKAIGLVVSAYALFVLTMVLGANDIVRFTSFIISIIYIATAAVWIVLGFWRRNALLRRFGLALSLLASAKLFLFDFRGIDAMGRTLLFIGFGIALLTISFGYGIAEKRLRRK